MIDTRKRVVQLVALCNEYCDKTGKEIELHEKTFAIWMFMDEDSKEKALRKNLAEGEAEFSVVCDHLEAISSEQGNRDAIAAYAKQQAPVKMDLSQLAGPRADAESPGAAPPLEVLARQKPSLMHLVRPSATNAAAAATARPSAPPSREWNLPVTSVAAGDITPMSAHLKEKARARARM